MTNLRHRRPDAKTQESSRADWLAAGALALTLLLALAGLRQLAGAQETADDTQNADAAVPAAAMTDAESNDAESSSDVLPLKWLPDQRVLAGAPTTTLDLAGAIQLLCDEGRLGPAGSVSPDDVELSVFSGQSSFADLVVDGDKLLIEWKPEATGKSTIVLKAANKKDESALAYVSFKAESWLPDYLAIMMVVLGGGGLFLLGMKRMSEGLQALAGQKLRKMIQLFTGRTVLALGVGVVVTTLVQSSTATSVMTLGFVNGGLMTLAQAIGVLMGANIGTTTTGWLFALNIGALGLPILGIAAIFYLFCKKERVQNVSIFLLGLGMIFFGLETLKAGLAPLPDTPQFSSLINMFRATSLFGAFMCVTIGCITTVIAHSSAATLAITMTLASLGALDLNSSAAIVLGSNIGTSLTPIIVAIGAPATTRRAAYFHVLFNTLGVVWVMAVFFPVVIPTINGLGNLLGFDTPGRIALVHTLFNVVNTIVFLPFTKPIARFLEKHVTDKEESANLSKTGLNEFIASDPQLAIEQSHLTVQRMFLYCAELVENFEPLLDSNFEDEEKRRRSFEIEDLLDEYQDETISFVAVLMGRSSAASVTSSGTVQITVAEEVESISDYLVSILKSNLKLKQNGFEIPERLYAINREHLQYARESLAWMSEKFNSNKRENYVVEMTRRRNEYVQRAKEQRLECLTHLADESANQLEIVAIDNQLHAWRRVYDHLLNIAEAMLPDANQKLKVRRAVPTQQSLTVNVANPTAKQI